MPFAHPLDRQSVVQRTASTSFVAAMEPERRAEVLARVKAFFDTNADTRDPETIGIPHTAEVYWCRRLG